MADSYITRRDANSVVRKIKTDMTVDEDDDEVHVQIVTVES